MTPKDNTPEKETEITSGGFDLGLTGKDKSNTVFVLEDGTCLVDDNTPDRLKSKLHLMNDIQNGKKITIK